MEGLNDGHKKNVKHLDFFKALKQLRGLCDVNVAWDKCVRFVVRCLFCGTLVLNWRIALVCWNFCWGFPIYNNSSFELKDCGFGELGGVFCLCFLFVYYNYGSKLWIFLVVWHKITKLSHFILGQFSHD